MPNPFICVSTFQEEDDLVSLSECSSPRRSKKSSKDKNNPFSQRGLDKFNTLLADLEEKKQKIYSQMGSDLDQDNALVRFVYSSSKDDVVPIVIRLNKDRNQVKSKSGELIREKVKYHHSVADHKRLILDKSPIEARGAVPDSNNSNNNKEAKEIEQRTRASSTHQQEKADKRRLSVGFTWDLKLRDWRRPSIYVPVAIILILLFLVFFGRSVAILCTSIGWYLVPTLSSKKQQTATKKKDYRRGTSEIKMVNNRSSPSPPRSSGNNNNSSSINKGVNKAGKENWHLQTGHRKSF